jgi:hypothetical protein
VIVFVVEIVMIEKVSMRVIWDACNDEDFFFEADGKPTGGKFSWKVLQARLIPKATKGSDSRPRQT